MSDLITRILLVVQKSFFYLSAIGTLMIAFVSDIRSDLQELASSALGLSMDGLLSEPDLSSLGFDMSIINAVIPLEEMFTILVGLFTFWSTILALKWIKRMIPFI